MPWLSRLPSQWTRPDTSFPAVRAFQIATLAAALLRGKDTLLKALGVNSGSSTVTRSDSYSAAGVLHRRYACIRAAEPESVSRPAAAVLTTAR
jgi:hypothetical protein